VLNPIIEPEVQKVAAAIRQSMENQRMMRMLLERVAVSVQARTSMMSR
jgi:histone-lysine N-methyltransferase SETD2